MWIACADGHSPSPGQDDQWTISLFSSLFYCGALATCDLPVAIGRGRWASKHSIEGTHPPPKAQRRSSCQPSPVFYQYSHVPTPTLLQYFCTAGESGPFSYSASRVEVKSCVWFPALECLTQRAEAGEAAMPSSCIGWQQACRTPLWARPSLMVCWTKSRGWGRGFCLLPLFFFLFFLRTLNWWCGKHFTEIYTYSVRMNQDSWAVREKIHCSLVCFDGIS